VRAAEADAKMATSTIVAYELWYGVAKSARIDENTDRLRTFLAGPLDLVPFIDEDAAKAGPIRAMLERAGNVIGSYDILIAAQALRLGAVLVTASVSEFRRIEDLIVEDWTR